MGHEMISAKVENQRSSIERGRANRLALSETAGNGFDRLHAGAESRHRFTVLLQSAVGQEPDLQFRNIAKGWPS